jgi:hypothetical protein
MDERKKHGWPFWYAAAAIVLPVLYVASSGPAYWLGTRMVFAGWISDQMFTEKFDLFYRPIVRSGHYVPRPVFNALSWYVNVFKAKHP